MSPHGPKQHPNDRLGDEELVEFCNHGDADEAETAFNTLYERHKDYVVRVALRYTNNRETALDVLQECFIYLLNKFPPVGEGLTLTAKLTTFLYPVARNLAISQQRKEKLRSPKDRVDPDELPGPSTTPAGDIGHILHELPTERREVVLMRFADDLSLREIAEILEIPVGTVKSRLHLAIRQLRESPELKKNHFS